MLSVVNQVTRSHGRKDSRTTCSTLPLIYAHSHRPRTSSQSNPQPHAVASMPTQSIGNHDAFSSNLSLSPLASSNSSSSRWRTVLTCQYIIFTCDPLPDRGPARPIGAPDPGTPRSTLVLSREGTPRIARSART